MSRYLILTGLVLTGLAFFGCASQGGVPTAADPSGSMQTQAAGGPERSGGVALWGYYNVFIDPKTWEAKVVPLRGPDFTVDVVSFMQPPMGKTSNLKILVTDPSQWFDQGKITVNVTLTHPFPGLDAYTGHDVMGVLVSPGSINGLYDSGVWYSNGIDDVKVLNADGYTRWMNPTEFMPNGTILNFVPGMMGTSEVGLFTATINGYKYFADNLGISQSVKEYYTDPNNAHNRGEFRAGVANTREYKLQFPFDTMPMMIFQYAVIASWVEATELDPSDIPGSFPRSANADEAIYMEVAADNSDLWYAGGEGGGAVFRSIWKCSIRAVPTIRRASPAR